MKIAVADFVIQCPVDAELIGYFENGFYKANLESCLRIAEAQNFEDKNPSDSRTNRLSKNVETYEVHSVVDYKLDHEYLFQMAMARAREESWRLAITRGSDGTPEYMEEQILLLVKD